MIEVRPLRAADHSALVAVWAAAGLPTSPAGRDGPTAFVSIMEGCSKYCSFCVVPYTRGEEFSRPFDDVITEVGCESLSDLPRGLLTIT